MNNYIDKLKHPKWQEKRLRILERDNFQCVMCGEDNQTLHVHHLKYNNSTYNPWDVDNKYLITICNDCHKLYHIDHIKLIRFFQKENRVIYTPYRLGEILKNVSKNNISRVIKHFKTDLTKSIYPDKQYLINEFEETIDKINSNFVESIDEFKTKIHNTIEEYYDKAGIQNPLCGFIKNATNDTT